MENNIMPVFIMLVLFFIITAIAVLSLRDKYYLWASFLSLRKIASMIGGEIMDKGEDEARLKTIMGKALKSYTGQRPEFPIIMRYEDNSGIIRMGYMELRTGSGREESIKYLSFFNFQGKWDLQGRIFIKPKNLMILQEVFESADLYPVTDNGIIPGFEDKFDVISGNKQAALEILNIDLQETLMKSLNCFPFNSIDKSLLIIFIERESLLITCEMATIYAKYESLYKTGCSISGVIKAILGDK